MATETVSSKGQVTPREVRASLDVGAGDRLDDGNYAIVPASRSIASLKGVLPPIVQPISLADMAVAIEVGAWSKSRFSLSP